MAKCISRAAFIRGFPIGSPHRICNDLIANVRLQRHMQGSERSGGEPRTALLSRSIFRLLSAVKVTLAQVHVSRLGCRDACSHEEVDLIAC